MMPASQLRGTQQCKTSWSLLTLPACALAAGGGELLRPGA